MPAQDMCDVVHYYFENDNLAEKEVQDAKVKMRRILYGQLYQRSYTWGSDVHDYDQEFGTQQVTSADINAGTPDVRMVHKPYIPPTPVNANSAKPYGNVLDPPLR